MFFPPSKPAAKTTVKGPHLGFPGLQLNLSVDHIQLLGTLAMMSMSRQPGFKQQMEEFMSFLKQIQQAAEAIAVQMESVQQEFLKMNAKATERQVVEPQPNTYVNPIINQLFRLMH